MLHSVTIITYLDRFKKILSARGLRYWLQAYHSSSVPGTSTVRMCLFIVSGTGIYHTGPRHRRYVTTLLTGIDYHSSPRHTHILLVTDTGILHWSQIFMLKYSTENTLLPLVSLILPWKNRWFGCFFGFMDTEINVLYRPSGKKTLPFLPYWWCLRLSKTRKVLPLILSVSLYTQTPLILLMFINVDGRWWAESGKYGCHGVI